MFLSSIRVLNIFYAIQDIKGGTIMKKIGIIAAIGVLGIGIGVGMAIVNSKVNKELLNLKIK